MPVPPTPTKTLTTPAQYCPGVGSQTGQLLERIGLRTAADLLFNFPRRYEDYTELTELSQLQVGELSSVVATIKEVEQSVSESGRHVLYLLVEQNRFFLRAIWFNQPFLIERFRVGQLIHMRGTVKERGGRMQMMQPHYKILEPGESGLEKKFLPGIF